MTTKMSEISIYVTIAFLILWCGLLLCLQKSGVQKERTGLCGDRHVL